jgi:hypothetical protein
MVIHRFDDMTLLDDEGETLSSPPVLVAGATGMSIFASPLSTAESTGGVSLGSRVGGVKLLLCELVADVCGGFIRGPDDNRFCSKSHMSCTAENHKGNRASLKVDTMYIRSGKHDQVRVKPCLATSAVPTNTTKEKLLGKRQEVDVWVTYFNAVAERDLKEAKSNTPGDSCNSSGSWTEVMVPTVEELSKARDNISTPRQLKLGGMLSVLSESHPTPLRGFEKISDVTERNNLNPDVRLKEMASEWGKVAKNFDIFESEHQVRCLDETKCRDGLSKAVGDLQDAINESDRKTELLVTRIGVETEVDGGSSLWEAVESASETLAKGKRKFDDYRKDQAELGANYLALKSQVAETEQNMTNLSAHYHGTMDGVKRQLKELRAGTQAEARPSDAFSGHAGSGLSHEGRGVPWSKHAESAQEVRSIKFTMNAGGNSGNVPWGGGGGKGGRGIRHHAP